MAVSASDRDQRIITQSGEALLDSRGSCEIDAIWFYPHSTMRCRSDDPCSCRFAHRTFCPIYPRQVS